jgi:internalin A
VDVSPLAGLNNLTNLYLGSNQIMDVSPLAGLEFLRGLRLYSNQIVDMCPLVGNPGIGSRDWVHLEGNPLSATSCTVCIPQLEARGVHVPNDCETPVN